jgi:uncharacterized protein (DUF983 family)
MTDFPLHIVKARPLGRAMGRGFLCRCPNCGEGKLFRAYLKVVDHCEACGEDLSHQRADDAPAYMTIFVVGHFIVSGVLATEFIAPDTPFWVPAAVWSALAVIASLLLLPRMKGALVGLQWANRMHGFGGVAD